MKIVFVTRESYEMPGGRIRCYDMAESLQKQGCDAEVFSFPDKLGAKAGKDESHITILDKILLNIRAFFMLLKFPRSSVIVFQRVHYHVFGPFLAAFLRRFRLVVDLDDWEFRDHERRFSKSKAIMLARFLARRARICFAASRYLKEFLEKANPRTYLLPSGIKLERLDPYRFPRPFKNGQIVFGWLGTVFRSEDVEDLKMVLRVFQDVLRSSPDLRLDIAGDGIYMDQVKEYYRRLKFPRPESVRFLGWLPPDSIGAYIYEVDIGLNPMLRPSKFNRSKCPVSMLEFMACSKPVISSRIGEVTEIIRNGTDGLIADNEKMFAQHMRVLVNEPVFRMRLGNAARERAEKMFSVDVLAADMRNILFRQGLIA